MAKTINVYEVHSLSTLTNLYHRSIYRVKRRFFKVLRKAVIISVQTVVNFLTTYIISTQYRNMVYLATASGLFCGRKFTAPN